MDTSTKEGRERRLRHLEAKKAENKAKNLEKYRNKLSVADNLPGPDSDPYDRVIGEFTPDSLEDEMAEWESIRLAEEAGLI